MNRAAGKPDKAADRLTKTVYPDGGEVQLTYNADASFASRVDQRGWKTSFTYDAWLCASWRAGTRHQARTRRACDAAAAQALAGEGAKGVSGRG